MSTEKITSNAEKLKASGTSDTELQLFKAIMGTGQVLLNQVSEAISDGTKISPEEKERLFSHMNDNFRSLFKKGEYTEMYNIYSHLTFIDRAYSPAESRFIDNTLDFIELNDLSYEEKNSSVCIKILNKLKVLQGHPLESLFYDGGRADTWRVESRNETHWSNGENPSQVIIGETISFLKSGEQTGYKNPHKQKLFSAIKNSLTPEQLTLIDSIDTENPSTDIDTIENQPLYGFLNSLNPEQRTNLIKLKNYQWERQLDKTGSRPGITADGVTDLYTSLSSVGEKPGYFGLHNEESSYRPIIPRLAKKFDPDPIQYGVSGVTILLRSLDKNTADEKLTNELQSIEKELLLLQKNIINQRGIGLHNLYPDIDILYNQKARITLLLKRTLSIIKTLVPNFDTLPLTDRRRAAYDDITLIIKNLKGYSQGKDMVYPYSHIGENLGKDTYNIEIDDVTTNQPTAYLIYNALKDNYNNLLTNRMGTWEDSQGLIESFIRTGSVQYSVPEMDENGNIAMSEYSTYSMNPDGTEYIVLPAGSKLKISDYVITDYVHGDISKAPLLKWLISQNITVASYFSPTEETDLSGLAKYTERYKKTIQGRNLDVRTYKEIFTAFDELNFFPPEEYFNAWLSTASIESSFNWDDNLGYDKREKIKKHIPLLEDITDGFDLDGDFQGDGVGLLMEDQEKEKLNTLIEEYKILSTPGSGKTEYDVYELNNKLADLFESHIEKIQNDHNLLKGMTLTSIPLIFLKGGTLSIIPLLLAGGLAGVAIYIKKMKGKIDYLRKNPNSFGLWQKNVDFLIEEITVESNIVTKYPELNKVKDSPKELRDILVKSLSGKQGGLSKKDTFKLLVEADFIKRFENHNIKDTSSLDSEIPENIDYFIVENYTGRMSPYHAAIQRELNNSFSGNLDIDGDLAYRGSDTRSIDWNQTKEKSECYKFIVEENEKGTILIPRSDGTNTQMTESELENYMKQMINAKTYAELLKSPLYNAIMYKVPLRERRMVPTHGGQKFTNSDGDKIEHTPQDYIDKVKERGGNIQNIQASKQDTQAENINEEFARSKMLEYLNSLPEKELSNITPLLEKHTGITVTTYQGGITLEYNQSVGEAIVSLQKKLGIENTDGLFGKITYNALLSYPEVSSFDKYAVSIDESGFTGEATSFLPSEAVEVITPGKNLVIMYYATLKEVKEKIASLSGPAFKEIDGKKVPVWFAYGDYKNGQKKIPRQIADTKEIFTVHGSTVNDDGTMNGGAKDRKYALSMTTTGNTIMNYPLSLGYGVSGTNPQLKKAGFSPETNMLEIAQETALLNNGKATVGANQIQVDTVERMNQHQRVATKNNHDIIKGIYGEELLFNDSADATYDENGNVITGAHGDSVSDADMIEMGGLARKERQEKMAKYRTRQLTQAGIGYFESMNA